LGYPVDPNIGQGNPTYLKFFYESFFVFDSFDLR
jgi:hypothetical protein